MPESTHLNTSHPITPRVHFSAIGGVAMVGGARLAIEAGCQVQGSDGPLYPPSSHMVEALGVPVAQGYAAENLDWNPDLVVFGNVLSRGNPEVETVLERRMRYLSLPEWLKDHVLRPRRPIAVCGTHGKTTTTALTAYLLDRAGLAPGYLVGGQPQDFPHSARLGAPGGYFVIEGDEYDTAFFDKRAKFFHYLPEIAIVTSIEFDHGDIYPDLDAIDLAFQRMLRQIPRTGALIVCADNRAASVLTPAAPCPVITYGFSPEAQFRGVWRTGENAILDVMKNGAPWGSFAMSLPGQHNAQNTLAALAAADRCGVSPEALAEALPGFHGVRRRMEVFLEANGVSFIDDFAHHPTAIRETIRAVRFRWPERRLLVAFEPRSNTTVTTAFQDDLVQAFDGASAVWLGPIYRAERIDPAIRLDRAQLAALMGNLGISTRYADDTGVIVQEVLAQARPGDVVLILSNGAFGGIYEKFRKGVGPQ